MASGVLFAEGFDWRADGGGTLSNWSGSWNGVSASYAHITGKGGHNFDTGRPWFAVPTTDHVVAHFYFKPGSHSGSEYGICAFLTNNTSTDWQLKVNVASDGAIVVYRGATELGRTAASMLSVSGPWVGLEIRVKFDNSAGEVEVRVNGVQRLSLTSQDTQDTAYADCTGFMFRMDVGNAVDVDDIVFRDYSVNSSMTGNYTVRGLMPNGNGNSSQFTGSDGNSTDNYLLVDEIGPDGDTTYVESSTVGHKDTYAMTNTGFSSATILAVQVHLNARKTDGVTRQIQPVLRHSTSETSGTTITLGTSFAANRELFDNVPGGTGWTLSQVDALEVGQTVIA